MGVPDLLALVEAGAAHHPIGQADRNEAFLERAHQRARPDQHGNFAERAARALQRLDLVADEQRLSLSVPDAPDANGGAGLAPRPERLAEPAPVVGDQRGRAGEDLRRRPVVLFQPHDPGAREVLLETQDVADLGAPPAVDRLVVVAHAADVASLLGQKPQPQILRDIGVLIFVDQDVAKARAIDIENVDMGGENVDAVQQEIAEIARVDRLQGAPGSGCRAIRFCRRRCARHPPAKPSPAPARGP